MGSGKRYTKPQDPTNDFEDMINDTTGLTGITKDNKDEKVEKIENQDKGTIRTSSDAKYSANLDLSSSVDSRPLKDDKTSQNTRESPSVKGEQSVSGDMPSPDSDDDVMENAKEMGIAVDSDEEHPQELDIGGDMDKAEEFKRTH